MRFVELPGRVTTRALVEPLPLGDLYCADLEARTLVLDRALATANARLTAAECLANTLPESAEAEACLDVLDRAVGD